MDEKFEEDEKLYRAVLPENMYWKPEGGVSSAAFKDKKGLSTDRSAGRNVQECLDFMQCKLCGSVVSITVRDCTETEALVKYDPLSDNAYHTEIHKDESTKLLTNRQAKFLATHSFVELRV